MATTSTFAIASRAALKTLFSDGKRPSGADFGTLIDAFVHRGDRDGQAGNPAGADAQDGDTVTLQVGNRHFELQSDDAGNASLTEAQRALLSLSEDGQWRVPAGNAAAPLAVDGWLSAAARVGSYVPSVMAAKPAFPGGDAVAPGKLPANGKWQVVLPAVNGCCAFEIVAHASGAAASGRHAMLHAVVVTSFNGSRKGIRTTRTERGWGWLRRIELSWRPRRSHWFARPTGYDLAIRTHFGYGLDDRGQPAQIRFHITRLW
ncbi:MAG: hypothetical protein RXR20_10010 [Paraburkholderia sp.]|jgi:hypothetical protein|uniref:hypothetical protein n=1 Tax=Burkholderiaceae TaxID=119060 RepID=UPI0010F61F50|nr:hypothetical protein [Burkholderia sp. 4M9327F10]